MSAADTLQQLARLRHCIACGPVKAGVPERVLNLLNGMCVRLAKDTTGWLGGMGKDRVLSLSHAPFDLAYDKKKETYDTDSAIVLSPEHQAKLLAAWRAQETMVPAPVAAGK